MQNDVQKVKSVKFGSGILSMSPDEGSTWINLGALKDATLDVSKSIIEFVVDNAKLPPKVKVDKAVFSAKLYEIDLENLQTIDGIATYSTIDASPVNVTAEAHGTGWVVASMFKLLNKNSSNLVVTSIAIKEDGVALTLNTDYKIALGADGYTYIVPLTSQAGVITADYTYTPATSQQQIFKDIVKTLGLNRFKFVNTDEDGKEFGIEFYEGYNRAGLVGTFQPDNTTDDALSIDLEIEAYPQASTKNLFRIRDEQNV